MPEQQAERSLSEAPSNQVATILTTAKEWTAEVLSEMLAGRRERSKAAKAQADEAEIRANLANKLLEEQWEEYYALKRRYRALEETRSKENEIEQAEEGIRTMRKEIRMVLDGGDGGRQREFETAADRTAVGRTEHSQDASDQEEAVTVYVERRGPVRIREPKSQKHGEWSEKSAREVLRGFMERPLIQAVLNYFESFLTMDMLEELGELLHEDPAACENLDALRERLGRRSKRLLRGPNGYLRHSSGGPGTSDMLLDVDAYLRKYRQALYGYGVPSPNPEEDSDVDPYTLSRLYLAFLRTDHATRNSCDSHAWGFLGEDDICNGCYTVGADLMQ
ncbi:hypothetical protein GTA08_BOTSDO05986 [Botryosphaeria dothidea]|uniref:Uncharacterized protein n=1 Tax=Botryosphaeria dothidea TaxID=55169 RepID=A0A8H4N524_9PEZI|nr:hypothetical protein GTA08_BOTSDO05986 [Botryosphaeria dothidea]